MDMSIVVILSLTAGVVSGVIGLHLFKQFQEGKDRKAARSEAHRIISKAKAESHRIEREAQNRAKDFEVRARRNVENDIRKEKQKAQGLEQNLKQKEQRLDQEYKKKEEVLLNKIKSMEQRSERLKVTEDRVEKMEQDMSLKIEELRNKIENVAGLSSDQAREELKRALEDEVRRECAPHLQKIEDEARAEANKKARTILASALSRYANEVATEKTVSIVPLTSDEMKGKIIGREGRNIRALEAACGVDLIIDETPEAVVISSFDPTRREIAKMTLERLMEDGRVHPARIEEVVEKVKQDIYKRIKEDGEKAAFDLGLVGIHPSLIQLIGSMKYRMTDSQSLYDHAIEVAHISGLIAAEVGDDINLAKRAGLLHDIGKAIDHTVEGSIGQVGAEFAKRHGEKEAVVDAIRSMSPGSEPSSSLGHIINTANSMAEARPGANRQMIKNFVKRLEDIESIGNSFDGVVRTYALQSGKEIRVIVESGKITDDQSVMLSRDIARKIEREANYPGQIKVSVIRETRIVEHAR